MKLYQKVLTAVAAVGLTTAAAFPYVKGYIDSLPKHLTTEQAGKAYLEAVCPINKLRDYGSSLVDKYNKEMNTQYYIGSAEMDYANQRVGELSARIKVTERAYAKAEITASKKLNDPKIIWPENVAKQVKAYSTQMFTTGGLTLDGKDDKATILQEKSNLASEIRQGLNLPPIAQGCK